MCNIVLVVNNYRSFELCLCAYYILLEESEVFEREQSL